MASNNAVTQHANCVSDQARERDDNQPVASRPLPSLAVTSTFNMRDLLCQLLILRSYPELSRLACVSLSENAHATATRILFACIFHVLAHVSFLYLLCIGTCILFVCIFYVLAHFSTAVLVYSYHAIAKDD